MTDDPIEAAYFGVYVWKAAAEKAGSFDVDKVRQAVYGMDFDAPGGKKKMDPKNQHTWKPVLIGEIKKDVSSKSSIRRLTWSNRSLTATICIQIRRRSGAHRRSEEMKVARRHPAAASWTVVRSLGSCPGRGPPLIGL